MAADEITQTRVKHSEPLITQFYQWIHEQRQRLDLLPKHPLTKALNYADKRLRSDVEYTMPAGMVTPVLAMNLKISQAVKRGLK